MKSSKPWHISAGKSQHLDLLKSDFAVINSVLAEYYKIEGVTGDQFRPVLRTRGSPRGGLLGMAAVSLMGGNGEETSLGRAGSLRSLRNC